ncbi:hypothetical protein WA158_007389 [Blastocystis sp. Blastoise]
MFQSNKVVDDTVPLVEKPQDTRITCDELMQGDCVVSGDLEKMGYYWNMSCLPQWKPRFCVVKGGYLWKYPHRHGTGFKGCPIPLEHVQYEIVDSVPERNVLKIYTLSKEWYFRFSNEHDLNHWIDCMKKEREMMIKVRMGHLHVDSITEKAMNIGDREYEKRLEHMKKQEPDVSQVPQLF